MKYSWKDYFSFNRRERNGILVLISFIAVLVIYLVVADYFPPSTKPLDFTSFKSDIEKVGINTHLINKNGTSSIAHIDINSADTSLLMTLPKMTSYCANMIVRYRKKLGGYYNVKQLTEVWGMDSSIYNSACKKVWVDTSTILKININTADIKQLAYHPYVRYYLAKAIVNYREEHGQFSSLSALHKMVAIDDSIYVKIIPYLTIAPKD